MINEAIIKKIEFEKNKGNGDTNYLTHNFHTYPAKFIPQIPRTVIKILTKEGDTVLDPFCGCGTTLVEAKLLGRNSIGVDLNPIATLVSIVKTTSLTSDQLKIIESIIKKIRCNIEAYYQNKKTISHNIPEFNNRDHWFEKNVLHELSIIKKNIDQLEDEVLKNYLYVAFSSIIVAVSNQESDTRFAAIKKKLLPKKTLEEFEKRLKIMNSRIIDFSDRATSSTVKVITGDARKMNFIKNNIVDLIITSPPYANTYDYYLYHKFRMYWMGYDVKKVQENEIGSRNRHSSKKEEISTFIDCLNDCMKEMSRVLKKNKYAVVVIGDSVIRGKLISANGFMKKIAKKNGFAFVKEISYNLKENSRMFNPKFTNGDKLEHIIFFKNTK